jgi:hypothetical protein
MTSLVFHAEIREGKLVVSDRQRWHQELSALVGKRVVVTVETEQQRRTSQANRYWRGVVVEFFREVWSQQQRTPHGLPPYSNDDAHDVLVRVLLGEEPGPMGRTIRKSTAHLPSDVFSKLVSDAKELAWQQYQARIPEPNEREI